MKKIALAELATLMMTGCATQTYVLSPSQAEQIPTYDHPDTFFVQGIGQEKTVDVAQICGNANNVAKITHTLSPLNAIIHRLQGIYTPRQTQVYCKQAKQLKD